MSVASCTETQESHVKFAIYCMRKHEIYYPADEASVISSEVVPLMAKYKQIVGVEASAKTVVSIVFRSLFHYVEEDNYFIHIMRGLPAYARRVLDHFGIAVFTRVVNGQAYDAWRM